MKGMYFFFFCYEMVKIYLKIIQNIIFFLFFLSQS